MLRKSILAARGLLDEPSIVQTPRARLFAGVPNAFFGVIYYAGVAAVSWISPRGAPAYAACAAAAAAAATSGYLAYSLVYVTKRSCPFCWTAHAVNWALVISVPWLLVLAQ